MEPLKHGATVTVLGLGGETLLNAMPVEPEQTVRQMKSWMDSKVSLHQSFSSVYGFTPWCFRRTGNGSHSEKDEPTLTNFYVALFPKSVS